MGEKKAPAGTATPQHPGFKGKHTFGVKTKKAPAGTATPQHPGFERKTHFGGGKKTLWELRRRNTLVLREKHTLGAEKKPCGNCDAATPWF